MNLVVRTPDELLAAVPHVLGFKPEESIVVIPFRSGLPVTRIDVPTTGVDRDRVWDALRGPYRRHAHPGAEVAIICVSKERGTADLATRHLANRLRHLGITVDIRLWSNGDRWEEFNAGASGLQTQASAEKVAAATVLAGAAQPAPSRASLAASMVGDREPIARLLPAARAAAASSSTAAERAWSLERLEQFHADGNRLCDVDGARMLIALESSGTRDSLWQDMSKENHTSHIAIWHDLTRRAPDEVRAAPASLLGFASWLHGDGAKAWCALDQVPSDRPYAMAAIVASALQDGTHPREWRRHRPQMRDRVDELDESFVPEPLRHERGAPRIQPAIDRTVSDRPGPDRPAPRY